MRKILKPLLAAALAAASLAASANGFPTKPLLIVVPYLFTVAGWLEGDGVDIADFPKVHGHFQRTGERPTVRQSLA